MSTLSVTCSGYSLPREIYFTIHFIKYEDVEGCAPGYVGSHAHVARNMLRCELMYFVPKSTTNNKDIWFSFVYLLRLSVNIYLCKGENNKK